MNTGVDSNVNFRPGGFNHRHHFFTSFGGCPVVQLTDKNMDWCVGEQRLLRLNKTGRVKGQMCGKGGIFRDGIFQRFPGGKEGHASTQTPPRDGHTVAIDSRVFTQGVQRSVCVQHHHGRRYGNLFPNCGGYVPALKTLQCKGCNSHRAIHLHVFQMMIAPSQAACNAYH